ncbi:hypothetical protein [Symbioplanes lichenis]|uniref:hypothetical protein n=1 Tax=Symbioplanes lichenis TaxID=1629072 RepID=UPI00273919E8|nr:hypothetical protein [Actinoplanes lichenis]
MRILLALAVVVGALTACSTTSPSAAPASSAPASPIPTFADVSRGDSKSVVKLISFDPQARSAVAEPTIFMQGPDFCEAFQLPASDPRCERDWSTEDSNTRVTVPIAADAELFTIHGGDPECFSGDSLVVGTCELTPAKFATLSQESGEMLVQLTVVDGTARKIAEVYTP